MGSLGRMIGAHPDDENTSLIARLARGRHVRTSYHLFYKGRGRPETLRSVLSRAMKWASSAPMSFLAVGRFDGGEQFFTRAIDFGFNMYRR